MKAMKILVFSMVLAGLLSGAACFWFLNSLHTEVYHPAAAAAFEVRRGESLDEILKRLSDRGVIEHPLLLRLYLKLKHQKLVVQAGNYSFPSPIAPLDVLQRLKQGGSFDRITVVEGWTRFEIADAMCKIPSLGLSATKQALVLLNDAAPVGDLDRHAQNLEGYLFPDTYFIVANSTAQEVVADMVKRFRQIWTTKLSAAAAARGMSAHQVVTMASIVETEAKLKQERPIIASVIENRLSRGMPLSMDSTLVYASKLAGAWKNDGKVYLSDVNRRSPYNTRLNVGLPPGPVGSPGLSSLEAVLHPAHTDYLYYVRNPDRNDGAHNFYANEKDFEAGVQALRAWEQEQHN